MTTTVTIKTHKWPVKAVITDRGVPVDWTDRHANDVTVTTQAIGPYSEHQLYMTDSRSLELFELAAPPAVQDGPAED